jgi:undecaprenyl-phosphate 4-deoxy-4-formamido-L-arabinose transferase
VHSLREVVGRQYSLEIVLVNDGSPDDSADVCRNLAQTIPIVRFVNLARNFGEHNAVMAGLHYATGDFVVIMDDDFQNPPSEVGRLLEEAFKGYDVVYSRYPTTSASFLRQLASRCNDLAATVLLGKPGWLYLNSFKVLSRLVVREITAYEGPFPFIDGLLLRVTRNFAQVDVAHHARTVGTSGYTFRKLLALWLNEVTGFSILPLRLASFAGLLFTLLSLLLAGCLGAASLLGTSLTTGGVTLIVLLGLGGLQLLALGTIGEYVGRLTIHATRAPQFVVREVVNVQEPTASGPTDHPQHLSRTA